MSEEQPEVIDTPWAKEAVRLVNVAIAEWNQAYPEKEKRIGIAWGMSNTDDHKENLRLPPEKQSQCGLCSFNGTDFEVSVVAPIEDHPLWLGVTLPFPRFRFWGVEMRTIYNVTRAVGINCRPYLERRKDNGIDVAGAQTIVYLPGLAGSVLHHALGELVWTRDALKVHLISDYGWDYWNGQTAPQ